MGYHSDSAIDLCTDSSADEQDCSFDTSFQVRTFVRCLKRARRIFVLCGAGLSATRGIPNFIDPGTLWRNQRAVKLSNIDTFNSNPGMVWGYFAELRNLALKARPNQAHVNLAELAWKKRGLMCLTEDIDGEFMYSPSSLNILCLYVLFWNSDIELMVNRTVSKSSPSKRSASRTVWITYGCQMLR